MSTATAAFVNLATEAALQLASAKRAQTRELEGSNAWRSLVRLKLLGQLAGLVLSAGFGHALGGASCLVAADAAFWARGAGAKRFECCDDVDTKEDTDVMCSPVPASVAKVLLSVNVVMLLSLLVGAMFGQNPSCGVLRQGGAAVYSVGVTTQTIGDFSIRRKKTKTMS